MPPTPAEISAILQGYLEALRRGDRARQRELASGRPELTEDFAALERAYARLGSALFSVAAGPDGAPGQPASKPPASGAPPRPLGGGRASSSRLPRPEAPSEFLGVLPELGAPVARGSEALLERLDEHASSFERYTGGIEIARGGMGSIRRVWDTDLRRTLVMKVMLSDKDRGRGPASRPPDARLLTRFLEEAQITAQLDHPGILPVHDIGVDPEGRLYFTMPLVIGQELGKAIEWVRQGQPGWTRARLLNHVRTAMEAVAFAHSRGVIHRDLKPENVMVGRFGETYVMDWGLARVLGAAGGEAQAEGDAAEPAAEPAERPAPVSTERFEGPEGGARPSVETLDGDVVGTPGYMAPEQARGEKRRVGPRADVYSMGAILYQVLTGHRPFGDPLTKASGRPLLDLILAHDLVPIRRLEKNVPGELVAIAEKAMARDPEARYASMIEMAEDLRAFLDGRVVLAYERGLAARARKWVQRNRLASAAFGLVVSGALVGTIAFIWQQQSNLVKLERERNASELARQDAQRNFELAEAARRDEAFQRERAEIQSELANEALAIERLQTAAAEKGRRVADEQRELARLQSEGARLSAERARHSTYAANLLAAQLALSVGNLAEARRGIEACEADLRGFEWSHLRQQTDSSRRSLEAHRGGAADVAVNPGELIASVGADGGLRLWDPSGGEPLAEFLRPKGSTRRALTRVAAAAGTGRLALADEQGGLYLVEPGASEWSPLQGPGPDQVAVRELAFSPDGRSLALLLAPTGFEPARLALYDLERRRWSATVDLSEERLRCLAWDPRGRRLAVGGLGGVVRVLDTEGPGGMRFVAEHRQPLAALCFDGDGSRLIHVSQGGVLEMHDAESGGRLLSLRLPEPDPSALCLVGGDLPQPFESATGALRIEPPRAGARQLVALGGASGTLRIYDLEEGLEINRLQGHLDAITSLAYDPLAETLVSSSADGRVKLWAPYQSQAITSLRAPAPGEQPAVMFVDQDRGLWAFSGGASGRRFDARATRQGQRLALRAPLQFGPFAGGQGGRLLGVSGGAPVELSSADGRELSRGPASPQPVRAAALSAEGTLLALALEAPPRGASGPAGAGSLALVFAIPAPGGSWQRPEILPLGSSAPRRLALSSLERLLVAEGDDGSLQLIELGSGRGGPRCCPPEIAIEHAACLSLALCAELACSLNGQRAELSPRRSLEAGPLLIDTRQDRLVQAVGSGAWLWRIARTGDGAPQLVDPIALDGHGDAITALVQSPDGERLVSASLDGSLRIWDPLLGQNLLELEGSGAPLVSAAFSNDGSRLASLAKDGELRLFETRPLARRPVESGAGGSSLLSALRSFELARDLEGLLEQRRRDLEPLGGLLEDAAEALSNPAKVLLDGWRVACDPDRDPSEHQAALREAEEALSRMEPAPIHLRTLAALELRAGRPSAALANADRALRAGLEERPELFAIQALAALRTGERARALQALGRGRELVAQSFWSRDRAALRWVSEAELALAEDQASGPSGE
jgi:serine/threonine protein kinase/WD40 repeat protein